MKLIVLLFMDRDIEISVDKYLCDKLNKSKKVFNLRIFNLIDVQD